MGGSDLVLGVSYFLKWQSKDQSDVETAAVSSHWH